MIDWDAEVIGPLMGEFGMPVTYIPFLGSPYPITGIFDDAYLKDAMFDDGTSGVTEVSAVLGVQVSQFIEPPKQNDQLLVAQTGVLYIVRQVRSDSHGGAKLMLSRVL